MLAGDSATEPPEPPRDFFSELYGELRALAGRLLSGERSNHTLQPTALVNEAFVRLHEAGVRATGRTHFMALAATAMRRVLVDYARKRLTRKRGGGWQRVTLSEASMITGRASEDVLELEEALSELEKQDRIAAEIVVLRFFGGLTEKEIAGHLGYSERWVRGEWAVARAWLKKELAG